MSISNKVWFVHGTTESGDDWILAFAEKPTEDRILLEIESDPWLSEEYEAECIQGWSVEEVEVLR